MDLREATSDARPTTRLRPSLVREEPGFEIVDTRRMVPAWCFVGLSLVCVVAMVWAGIYGSHDCRVKPIPLLPGVASNISLALPANTPCTILVAPGSAILDDITIDAPPGRGTLTSRGRSGVVYRPDPGFKGADSFAFSLHGRPNATSGAAVVHVRATIDQDDARHAVPPR
jgi:hypothetical protein